MSETLPNPNNFSRNEKERDYTALINVRGLIEIKIKADSKEDAEYQIRVRLDEIERDGYVEIDAIKSMQVLRLVKDRPMYRVTRDGQPMQVTDIEPGDAPRSPTDTGF